MQPEILPPPWSLLFAPWFLWLRAALVSAAGYFLCRRRKWLAVVVACLAAYWAYNSISLMVECRRELIHAEGGLRYVVQAHVALLLPFALMGLGLVLKRKGAEPAAAPNGGPAGSSASSEAGEGPPSVS